MSQVKWPIGLRLLGPLVFYSQRDSQRDAILFPLCEVQ